VRQPAHQRIRNRFKAAPGRSVPARTRHEKHT
jgi:hypothetical protein